MEPGHVYTLQRNPLRGMKVDVPKSIHDQFVNDTTIQPAFGAPDPSLALFGAQDPQPVTKYGEGNPYGAVPRYADVSKPGSLYTVSTVDYPWRPNVSRGLASK